MIMPAKADTALLDELKFKLQKNTNVKFPHFFRRMFWFKFVSIIDLFSMFTIVWFCILQKINSILKRFDLSRLRFAGIYILALKAAPHVIRLVTGGEK